jgi:sterol desaturase/sphingolipid hydroxylase (fatty acid hydroxylase superfamily)
MACASQGLYRGDQMVGKLFTQYWFYLVILSLAVFIAERVRPWRKEQKVLRPEWKQDVFWLIFNGYFVEFALALMFIFINRGLDHVFNFICGSKPQVFKLLSEQPLWLQIILLLIAVDFIEWSVHYQLHRRAFLWNFHRVHHSIVNMDWIGNFRIHWFEFIVYRSVKYLPVTVLDPRWEAVLAIAVIATAIGNLNHSNLNISWGPLRYFLNSPRMHIWHHEKKMRGQCGVNFGVVLSVWDWLFRTAWMPETPQQPEKLGFIGQRRVPANLLYRFFLPWHDNKENND